MLASLHRQLGLSRAVLVQASCHGTDNRAMLDAMAWSAGAWRGVAMVDATVADADRATETGGAWTAWTGGQATDGGIRRLIRVLPYDGGYLPHGIPP